MAENNWYSGQPTEVSFMYWPMCACVLDLTGGRWTAGARKKLLLQYF